MPVPLFTPYRQRLGKWLYISGDKIKNAILKYAAGALEKLAVGSMLVGLYQGKVFGIWIGLACFFVGCIFSAQEVK
jgi:hypothetical protein